MLSVTCTFTSIFFSTSCSFVVSHYDEVKPYFAMDPLLPAVFVALTPEAEFPLLCEWIPPFLTASRLTHILKTGAVDIKVVYLIYM